MDATLSTHVLDTATGLPAQGVGVTLYRIDGAQRTTIGAATTNADGRTGVEFPRIEAGTYALVFNVQEYFDRRAVAAFYDEIIVRFRIGDDGGHYHVPLLLSPWGYSTYRGS
jgi:5-hydroxyisourate hydrolase